MRKLIDHGGSVLPPYRVGDWVTYAGSGDQVKVGTRGKLKRVYTDTVEVEFDCGTTLVTAFENVKAAPPPRESTYLGGWYA